VQSRNLKVVGSNPTPATTLNGRIALIERLTGFRLGAGFQPVTSPVLDIAVRPQGPEIGERPRTSIAATRL
jgi:hypothetical protein